MDDIDRLEPAEVMEILRLIRAVADFPNITYVLCFDQDILAKSITAAMSVDDGAAYLEKIIQVQISVPAPEPFQLRHWFRSELATFATSANDDQTQRLVGVIDHEGGRRLQTPRAVVRALNGIRLFWPSLEAEGADLPDLVWLQIIRATSVKYFKWIERYCNTCAVLSSGKASLEKGESQKDWDDLIVIFEEERIDRSREYYFLQDILPGIDTWPSGKDADPRIYRDLGAKSSDADIQRKRLKSPDHYRMYFALAQPTDAPTASDFVTLWNSADSGPETLAALLLKWHQPGTISGVSKTVIVLNRVSSAYASDFTSSRSESFLIAFADIMDDAARKMGLDEFYGPEVWDRADGLIPILLTCLQPRNRSDLIVRMFSGRALGWLTSVFRRETFAHGRYGNQQKPPEDHWFTADELNQIGELLLGRYRALSLTDLLSLPKPLSLLFAWQQGGDLEGPSALIAESSRSDEGLVDVLEKISGRVMRSPGGEVVTLSRSNVGSFLDFEEARFRVAAIAASGGPLAARAAALEIAFSEGDRY